MILVTGASGFVGSHIVRLLTQQGKRVRCFLRKSSSRINLMDQQFKGKLEFVYGDLRDSNSIKKAVKGCDVVYHIGAYVHLWYSDPKLVYDVNWGGSRNVFQACLEEGVKKVVYTNTAAILKGGTKDHPSVGDDVLELKNAPGHYTRSKLLAYEEAVNYFRKGLNIITVNPTTPVGDGDYKLTPPGKMIVDFLNNRLPAYIETVINYIDVEDVAAGHILAEEKGKGGQRYILGNCNLTLEEVFEMLTAITGKAKPSLKLPAAPLLPLGFLSQKICEFITHKEPLIPWEGLRLGRRPFAFDCSKAIRELGLPQSDIKEAFRKAVNWFYANGYVRGTK
ncbi:MAG: NAD-dependent epimerase/dehydratase family protein [Candidatus Omnitrophota bacterium]